MAVTGEIWSEEKEMYGREDVVDSLGDLPEPVKIWLLSQIVLLEVEISGKWWVDRQPGVFVSAMDQGAMAGVEQGGNDVRLGYVINLETGKRSRMWRDGRGWVKQENEQLFQPKKPRD